jgi:putative sterol carrier protein
MPNAIYGPDFDVVGVLDWEMAYIGDPISDLGWFFFLDWQYSDGYGIPRLEGSPEREETVQRYQELTGWKADNLLYSDVIAAFRFGVIMAKIAKNMKATGVPTPTEDFARDNPCTQRLASLLDLPAPGGPKREMTNIEEVTVRVQLHLTGPKGSDWYVISDKGVGTRHEGTVENPDATLTVTAEDWDAVQKGELDRVQAFMSGKLKIEGDLTLMMQLEDTISRLSQSG